MIRCTKCQGEGETVFDTDGLGIVYARELERI